MKTKVIRKIVVATMIFVVGAAISVGSVFADDSGSGSSGGQATTTTCNTATHVKNTEQCSDNYGGASWHIFSVNYPPVLNNNLDRVQPWSLGPTYNTNEKFMKDGGYDWAFSCPASKYDYYLAYVYDGWNGLKMTNGPVWYGPLQWQVACGEIGDHCNHPVYHTRNAHSYATGVESMRNGTANTLRITGSHPTSKSDSSYVSGDALAFYQKYCYATGRCDPNSSSIPAIGYFCIPKTPYYTPFSANSSIDIKVNNSDGPIYVKPGDSLVFKTNYYPGAQAGYGITAQSINVDGEGIRPGGYTDFLTLGTLFGWYSGRGGWQNAFTVSKNFSNEVLTYSGTAGNTSTFNDGDGNSHTVRKNDVGENSPVETAALTRNTPGSVYSRSYYDAYVLADINTQLSDSAKAAVPYNFTNSINITTETENKDGSLNIAYAGETKDISFDITTNLRRNNLIGDEYATIVRNAHTRLKICYTEGGCYYSEPKKIDDLHVSEDIKSVAKSGDTTTINIPDIRAGSEVCIQAGIYPKDSYSDNNIKMDAYNINDDNSWQYSGAKCYKVAKRPSIQFWGGNVFSRGNLNTSTAEKVKKNLAGYSSSYSATAESGQAILAFGSWGELGVVGNGTISGFGSGASMGYGQNGILGLSPNSFANNSIVSNPGGGRDSSFCKRIPLTIPNSPCDDPINGLSSAINITKAASDKESIVTLLASGDASKMTNYAHYDTDETITKAGYNAIGETIDGSTTRVVSSDGSITIGSDLDYLNGEYTGFSQMPKLIIYAKKNIYIDCGVNRIDALLIANDTVVTCNNFENDLNDNNVKKRINDPDNSVQLTVNGAIIAKRLIPNRTYGAATGVNSIVPAEIVNFDPTLYQFGGSAESDDDTTGRLDMTYIHELAPRL